MAKVVPCIQDKPKSQVPQAIMSLIEEKNLKVIVFGGKQEDWKFWEMKFLARARRKGVREILLGTVKILTDLKLFDLTVPAEKAQSKICN